MLCINADGNVKPLELEIPGGTNKYITGGVLDSNGCIYFAPFGAGKVLCINAEGNVELLEPEIPGDNKYHAGGVLAPNGCIYCAIL